MTDASTCQNLKDKKSNFIETLKIDGFFWWCLNERKKYIRIYTFEKDRQEEIDTLMYFVIFKR
jgi:hypothetical protein